MSPTPPKGSDLSSGRHRWHAPWRRSLAGVVAAAIAGGGLIITVATPAVAFNPCNEPNPLPRCFNPPPQKPRPQAATPNTPIVTGVTSSTATITWTDPAGGENGFIVYRSAQATADSAPQYSQTVVPFSGASTYSLRQTDLPPTETVWWNVVATAAGKNNSNPTTAGTLTVDLPTTGNALPQLQAFQSDWQNGAFPNVSKAATLQNAAAIVDDPLETVDQAGTGACGPAAAEVEYASRNPSGFVDTIRTIFDTGAFRTSDGTTYTASSALRNSPPNPTVEEANWLFMATLRDSGNPFSRITSTTPANDIAWLSTPAEVDDWLSHIVGLHTTTATALLWPFTSGESVMPQAASVLPGGAVVLLVDSSLVGNEPDLISEPNHYVDVRSWSSSGGDVTFTVDTWGQLRTFTYSWSHFDGLTWDVLTAQ